MTLLNQSESVETVVERALLERVVVLELAVEEAQKRADEAVAAARLAERERLSYERCYDVVRESTFRLRVLIRQGDLEEAAKQVDWIVRQHPQHWGPKGTLPDA